MDPKLPVPVDDSGVNAQPTQGGAQMPQQSPQSGNNLSNAPEDNMNRPAEPTSPITATPKLSGDADDLLVADDVDVIEKEWVDKAKRIVEETKFDPRKQEAEVSKLQAEYLNKRYSKKIRLAD